MWLHLITLSCWLWCQIPVCFVHCVTGLRGQSCWAMEPKTKSEREMTLQLLRPLRTLGLKQIGLPSDVLQSNLLIGMRGINLFVKCCPNPWPVVGNLAHQTKRWPFHGDWRRKKYLLYQLIVLEPFAITCSQHCMPTSALIIQAVWSLMSQEVSPWPLASLFAVCLWIVPEVWFLRLDPPCSAKKTPVSTSASLCLIISQQWNICWADFLEELQ